MVMMMTMMMMMVIHSKFPTMDDDDDKERWFDTGRPHFIKLPSMGFGGGGEVVLGDRNI